ncbi:MAG TPA: hypothetical protein VG963_16500 [Polyangiaceae bacterium]|nr:hypothetical protein [Polyangiaceae bacterium]
MPRSTAYPPDLARYVADHWPAEGAPLPPPDLFGEALSVAYQASLTAEEGRPTNFRLLLTDPEQLPESGAPNDGVLRLAFEHDRPFSANELRRLSPAAPFEVALIGAHVSSGKLRIWGIAHSGAAWLRPTWGGRGPVPNWSYDPIVHVTAPGQIAVRCAGNLIGALERGTLVDAMLDVFDSKWLPALFERELLAVQDEHATLQAGLVSPTAVERSLVGIVGEHMLRRAIRVIRDSRHGGMILVAEAPNGARDKNLAGLRLKYQFGSDEPPRRYRSILFQILDRLAARSTKASVGWSDFALDDSPELEKLERSVFELSRVISSLSAIDGAVVLDKRLLLVGFGAEVSADLPAPEQVFRAIDLEGERLLPEPIENVGTRHRAAYRFVQHHSRGLAIVISADGGISFVANRQGKVVFWEQSVTP